MRDRVFQFLQSAAEPRAAVDILREALNVHAPNPAAAEKVLRAIVGRDRRFRRDRRGWSLAAGKSVAGQEGLGRIAFLHIEQSAEYPTPAAVRGAIHASLSGRPWEFDLAASKKLPEVRGLRRLLSETDPAVLAAWGGREIRLWNRLLLTWGLETWKGETLSLSRLAAKFRDSLPAARRPEELAGALGLPAPDPGRPARMALFLGDLFQALLDRVPEGRRTNFRALRDWIEEGSRPFDFSRCAFGKDFLDGLPEKPGIYLMRNRAGDIIYVGKSRNLRRRVRGYFTAAARRLPKVALIQDQIHELEVSVTSSEVEALLLEMRLIRDFRPAINLQSEVHEAAGRYGRDRNLILLVGEPECGDAHAYFLRDGSFVARHKVALGRDAPRNLRRKIASVFYPKRRRSVRENEPWEAEIVSRWLAANRTRLNYVDLDEAGGLEAALRCINAYLRDPDKLDRKVIYR